VPAAVEDVVDIESAMVLFTSLDALTERPAGQEEEFVNASATEELNPLMGVMVIPFTVQAPLNVPPVVEDAMVWGVVLTLKSGVVPATVSGPRSENTPVPTP